MRKFDLYNLVGGLLILVFSISYFNLGDLSRAYTTLGISLLLIVRVGLRWIKNRK